MNEPQGEGSVAGTLRINGLVLDFNFYPRTKVDNAHIDQMVEAIKAGVELPPVVADAKTKRVVDGFHRCRAYAILLGPDADVPVELRTYESDADLFADAMRLNAHHGKPLTTSDRARCISQAEEYGLTADQVGGVLGLTLERVSEIRLTSIRPHEAKPPAPPRSERPPPRSQTPQVSSSSPAPAERRGGNRVPAKRAAESTEQVFLVNQLINLFEENLVDWQDDYLSQRITVLKRTIEELNIPVLRQRAAS